MADNIRDDRLFPRCRREVSAVRYWRDDAGPPAQRWYIHLCLFAASVHDHFLGQKEAESGNHNWSATMSYYAVVHACRAIVFQCFGDFPRAHNEMAVLLNQDVPLRAGSKVRFNWLSEFSGHSVPQLAPRTSHELEETRRMLDEFLREELLSTALADRLRLYGPLVSAAKELREDSNYEALLIAHERQHPHVTPAVESLSSHLTEVSRAFISLARDALIAGLKTDREIENDRPRFMAFAGEFFRERLRICLRDDLSPELHKAFVEWIESIGVPPTELPTDSLWDNVSYGLFGPKAQLMKAYIEKIDQFGERTRHLREAVTQETLFDEEPDA
jgi:hypothetical protein